MSWTYKVSAPLNARCDQCRKPCPEHGCYDCSKCHKHTQQCDCGGCRNEAVKSFANRYANGQICEVRAFCSNCIQYAERFGLSEL